LYNNQSFLLFFFDYSSAKNDQLQTLKVTILSRFLSFHFSHFRYSSCLQIIRAIDCKRTISRGREMAVVCHAYRRLRESRYVRGGSARGTSTENQTLAIALRFTNASIISVAL